MVARFERNVSSVCSSLLIVNALCCSCRGWLAKYADTMAIEWNLPINFIRQSAKAINDFAFLFYFHADTERTECMHFPEAKKIRNISITVSRTSTFFDLFEETQWPMYENKLKKSWFVHRMWWIRKITDSILFHCEWVPSKSWKWIHQI